MRHILQSLENATQVAFSLAKKVTTGLVKRNGSLPAGL